MTRSTIEMNQGPSRRLSRRQMLCCAGAGAGAVLGGSLAVGSQCNEKERILQRGDQIDVEGKAEEIVENAYKLGFDYEKTHGGCARCTVAACQDAIPFVPVDVSLFRGSTCLDGGATPTGIQNCGGFTGAGMVIGHVCGSTRDETFKGDAGLAHELLHKVYDRFKEHYGTVLCRDVREGAEGNCPEVVGRAAKWVAEVLLEEFTDYVRPEEVKEETEEPKETEETQHPTEEAQAESTKET